MVAAAHFKDNMKQLLYSSSFIGKKKSKKEQLRVVGLYEIRAIKVNRAVQMIRKMNLEK